MDANGHYHAIVAAQAMTDETLIAGIARGDRTAMHALYARHSRSVYRFALRMMGDPTAADDIVSTVFLDVHRAAGTFEARSRVSTWLLAICRNKVLALRRRRTPDQLSDADAMAIEDDTETPEQSVVREDAAAALRRALTRLSAAHREVIDLVYYQNMSVEEAGQVLGVPKNTVKTRMFYARKQLARLLAEADGGAVTA
ncbi:MAG: RNA polymerase subunit sigma [Proteobacteria bacterium]|nr:MAG: RNA polymerase subunit sigma [Pseudomonadota bacterium]